MYRNSEDTTVARRAPDALGAWLNAIYREKEAVAQHEEFFKSKQHARRVGEVCDILENFFERNVDYITARGINRETPFDNIKMAAVGPKLSKISKKTKWDELYAPLLAVGDVDVLSTNGHLLVRVYPVGQMPKKPSKNSISHWYKTGA